MPNNAEIQSYTFLDTLSNNEDISTDIIDNGRTILINTCDKIENNPPDSLDALYTITTQAYSDFVAMLQANDYEINDFIQESVSTDLAFIAQTYGFTDVDNSTLTATRFW